MSSKAEWVTYAGNIAGNWQLCANCQPDTAAKKLFRQYNFNRRMLLLPIALSPIDNTESCAAGTLEFRYNASADLAFMSSIGGTTPFCYMAQMGRVLDNPIGTFDQAWANTFLGPGDPGYAEIKLWCQTIGGAETWDMCQCTPNGAPGLKIPVLVLNG